MARYKGYIFDLDGTLYRGNEVLEHAAPVLQSLVSEGAQVRYLTNNSSQTPEALGSKLAGMGLPVEMGWVHTSAMGAAEYLVERGIQSAFVVGEAGLVETLVRSGIKVPGVRALGPHLTGTLGAGPAQPSGAGAPPPHPSSLRSQTLSPSGEGILAAPGAQVTDLLLTGLTEAGPAGEQTLSEWSDPSDQSDPYHRSAVVVGICRHFTYDLLDEALQHLLAGAEFVATNKDTTFPREQGRLSPGAGSIVAALEAASGQKATSFGKPHPKMILTLAQQMNLDPKDVLVVGDRLDTDIEAGRRAGCPVHLVLTGVTQNAPKEIPSSADLRGLLN